MVRVRFAPSPSGWLHIGGARTALFNYLFARHHGGRFIIRIEDTDRKRSTPESEAEILSSLAWLGMESDEPILRQSERTERYRNAADQLLQSGAAYHCWCSAETIAQAREEARAAGRTYRYPGTCRDRSEPAPGAPDPVLRLRVPQGQDVVVDDLVRGRVTFKSQDLDDWILARSDGTPTYNFVVVVDDSDMEITHVIRGDDHLSNTPKQVVLYRALGRQVPHFAHVSTILGPDKARLSKRHGSTSVQAFRDQGYLPDAFVNFLARLGWSHGDKEIFTRDQLIEAFDLDGIQKSAAVFNTEKMLWTNAQHLMALSPADLLGHLRRFAGHLPREEAPDLSRLEADSARAERVLTMLQPRSHTLSELVDGLRFYLDETIVPEEKLARKFLVPEKTALLAELARDLTDLDPFDAPALETFVRGWTEARELKLGAVAQPLRVALTGSKASPGLFDVMEVLGRDRCLARITAATK